MSRLTSAAPDEGRVVSDEFIREAIDQSHLNALRLALFQVTQDPEIGQMKAHKSTVGGREFADFLVDQADVALLKSKAFDYLRNRARNSPIPPPPSKNQTRLLLESFAEPMDEAEFELAYEELAFEDYPRDAHWTIKPNPDTLGKFSVAVIGGGISGIAAALQLKRLGIPYVVLERQEGVGGTWRLNNYPDIRVDTYSYAYQFKFEKNFAWSEYYPTGEETLNYLEYIAEKYGILENFQFSSEVMEANWQEESSKWELKIRRSDGNVEELQADAVITATGLFSKPKMPEIPGISDFSGAIFHTAQWDHGFEYEGKRVALIGNGSTGTQLAPGIAAAAERLTVFQRTPTWIMAQPLYRKPVTEHVHWLFDNLPYYWNWYCYASFYTSSQMQFLQTYDREWQAKGGNISQNNDQLREMMTEYIRSKVGDRPELFEKLVPDYAPLVRRLVVDNGFYDMLRRDNVELITERIECITSDGVRTDCGQERNFDLIILGTGFAVQEYFWPVKFVGREANTLDRLWAKDGARSYLGIAMPGFPNLFSFYGPAGQPRAVGFYSWAEIWARYIGNLLVHMIEKNVKSLEVKRGVFDEYNARLDEEIEDIIWTAEGASYYVNAHGRAATQLPWVTHDYHSMVHEPNLEDYQIQF